MTICANRLLCTVRDLFSALICSTRIPTTRLFFPPSSEDSHAVQRTRKHYHSDTVTRFRNVRLHVGRLPKVPHALKATEQTSEDHNCPAGSAGSHNNASNASLLLPFQVGRSDEDDTRKAPKDYGGSVADFVSKCLDAGQNQVAPLMALDKSPHKESKITEVIRDNLETCATPYSVFENGDGHQRVGKKQNQIDFDGIHSDSPIDFRNRSIDMPLNFQTDESSVAALDKTPVFKARPHSRNSNDPAILKARRNLLNATRVGDLRNAFNLYLVFAKLAKPDAEMADVLIRALCRGTLQAPPRQRILQAIQVYNILLQAERQNAGDDDKNFFHSRSPPSISEQRCYTRIYNTLLRALSAPLSLKSSPRDTIGKIQEEYTKISMEILAAMEARGLVPDNRTVCSILLLRFRGAANHEEAFELYRSTVAELEAAHARGSTVFDSDSDPSEPQPHTSGTQPLLDVRGYRIVLNAFGKLSFPSTPVAPAPLWYVIVSDMRERGHAVTVEDYTIYLGGILAQATSPFTLHRTAIGFASPQDEEARVEAMLACVKHVHKRLALDVTIAPDATLMNTLLNVYQHLGAFEDAIKVFNTMWLSNRMDDVTPVIVFDTCGHARRPHEATMIWCKLVEKGWQFDKRTLDTWVECLCRVGNVEAACKFVCMYMGRDKPGYSSKGNTRPDVQTCLILLKLSWVVGQNLDVKEKLRTHLPHIWKILTAHYT